MRPALLCVLLVCQSKNTDVPAAPPAPPSDERFANRYLLIAAAKDTAAEARAAGPAGATIIETNEFSSLKPCLFAAVVADYRTKEEALAARKTLLAKGVDAWPRHSGRFVAKSAERAAFCAAQRASAANARSPRWVHEGGSMELHGQAPGEDLTADPSGEIHLGDKLDVYAADGTPLATACAVKGFTAAWSGTTSYEDAPPCGTHEALAQLDCHAGGKGAFALKAGTKAPVQWKPGSAPAPAQARLNSHPIVTAARERLRKSATADLAFTESIDTTSWQGPQGTVTFTQWLGRTGEGVCGSGDSASASEVVLWPPNHAGPRVLLPIAQRARELIGVTDLDGDGTLELSWSEDFEVWMDSGEGTARLLTDSTPFCGCGC